MQSALGPHFRNRGAKKSTKPSAHAAVDIATLSSRHFAAAALSPATEYNCPHSSTVASLEKAFSTAWIRLRILRTAYS
jgi:hypothetical protein